MTAVYMSQLKPSDADRSHDDNASVRSRSSASGISAFINDVLDESEAQALTAAIFGDTEAPETATPVKMDFDTALHMLSGPSPPPQASPIDATHRPDAHLNAAPPAHHNRCNHRPKFGALQTIDECLPCPGLDGFLTSLGSAAGDDVCRVQPPSKSGGWPAGRTMMARATSTPSIIIEEPRKQYYVIRSGPFRGIHFATPDQMWCLNPLDDAWRTADMMMAVQLALVKLGQGFTFFTAGADEITRARQVMRNTALYQRMSPSLQSISDASSLPTVGTPVNSPPLSLASFPTNTTRKRNRRHTLRRSQPTISRFIRYANLYIDGVKILAVIYVSCVLFRELAARIGFALCATSCSPREARAALGRPVSRLGIDTCSTFSSTYNKADLINYRDCKEKLMGPDGSVCISDGVGDLPCALLSTKNQVFYVTFKNVRVMPDYCQTLLSIHELWETNGIKAVFDGKSSLIFPDGKVVNIHWGEGVYAIRAVVNPERRFALKELKNINGARALAAHNPHAQSHLHKLPPNEAARLMHGRLHISLDKIKHLAYSTRDAPKSLALATETHCEACALANARRLPHPNMGYAPSCVGSIIYMDDAGPHSVSALGGVKYFRIFIDSHSRFRLTYLLRSRTDGLEATSRFTCEFNALAGACKSAQLIQCLHSDNAPEIVSNEFQRLLSERGIKHQTSPAHIKQPNGIAERAIGTSRAIARSAMVAANAPLWTWGCAILHAEDVLNHCNGPSDKLNCKTDYISSYQLITGQQPNIMKIMPFGCLAIATKPPAVGNKIAFGERGIRAFNLGRCREQPGTYRLWAPSEHKILTTSDVVFYEEHFPWRLKLIEKPFADDKRNGSTTVLNLFSGKYGRTDGLSAALKAQGYKVIEVDNSETDGGGHAHDILNDKFFNQLLEDCKAGKFRAVYAAPPCSTFSVSRFFDYKGNDNSDRGPLPVRNRKNILGLPNLTEAQQTELRTANTIVTRCVAILDAVAEAGGSYVCENPSDRGNPKIPVTYIPALQDHGPLWLMPDMMRLETKFGGKRLTFAQCEFGSIWQKYTTIAISPDLMASLGHLSKMCCSHVKGEHEVLAGKDADGKWISRSASAYPPKLCKALAAGLPPIEQRQEDSDMPPRDSGTESDIQTPKQEQPEEQQPLETVTNDEDANSATTPDKASEQNTRGPRPDGGTFNFRSKRGPTSNVASSLCAIVDRTQLHCRPRTSGNCK